MDLITEDIYTSFPQAKSAKYDFRALYESYTKGSVLFIKGQKL